MDQLLRAVDVMGSQTALAHALGVRQGHVWAWINRTGHAPLEHCPAIEAATGGKVRCEQLRSDVIWQRNERGQVTGYTVPIKPLQPAA